MLNVKRIAGLAFVLVVIGIIGSLFTANTVAETYETETMELQNGYEVIEIQTDNAQVEVLPATNGGTTVEFNGNPENKQRFEVKATIDENILSVVVKERGFRLFNFDFTFSSPKLTVYVPEQAYEAIHIETDNGRAEANGLEAQDMEISTSNGRAVASELDVNKLHVTTDNGRIEMKDIQSSIVTTEVDNGRIELENVDGELIGKTSNGRITLTTENLDRPIDFATDNGRIHIQTKNKPTNVIFDITIDNGKATVFGNSNWDTVVGEGENLIKLKTDNGKIIVE